MTEQLSKAELSGESYPKVTGGGPRSGAQNEGHVQNWLSPTVAKALLIITNKLPDPKLRKNAHQGTHPIAP